MERYLPVAAALLALPHLLSIAAARHPPLPVAATAPPRVLPASAAHPRCAAVRPPMTALRAVSRRGFVGFAQQPYLQP